ncbi:MAG: hypothetical protein PWR27_2037 [Petroclostridium sp.]|nr:putative protein with domain [Clostridia bacterium]MDK2811328.1 hypothetical protein [Petroclostridium sp.]
MSESEVKSIENYFIPGLFFFAIILLFVGKSTYAYAVKGSDKNVEKEVEKPIEKDIDIDTDKDRDKEIRIQPEVKKDIVQAEEITAQIIERRIRRRGLDISYPQIAGLKDSEIQDKINGLIVDQVQQLVYDQIRNASEIKGGYKVKLNQKGILSLVLEQYSYATGAAHGTTQMKSVTVDLETAKVYELKDLFDPNSNYIERINRTIKKEIREKNIPLLVDFQGIKDNQRFYLTEKDIVLYYQLYEYTPYAYGIPEFNISFASISDTFAANGPLARFRT